MIERDRPLCPSFIDVGRALLAWLEPVDSGEKMERECEACVSADSPKSDHLFKRASLWRRGADGLNDGLNDGPD